uniref:Large subunit GTPase 1 n=1 Tax=Schizaphis graminum TaxID=13262 RepID=A0A2S2NMX6_SCHGA
MVGTLTDEERSKIEKSHKEFKHFIKIPRRPEWDDKTTAEDLESKERQNFLEWRRKLAELQEEQGLVLTPYEKNLGFWRQLWRVVERSDVLVQIVDARNPLLFYCEDLEKYSKEVDTNKTNLLLLNKSDLLTAQQRKYWAKYFDSRAITVAFYSAKQSEETIEEGNEDANETVEKVAEEEEIEEEEEEDEEEELELEDEDEVEEDEKAAIVPKKPENKVVTNDAPTKPSFPANKIEQVKVPDVLPTPKDEIKNPEPPKVLEETTGEKEKLKNDIDNAKKSETPAKLKPEFEAGEREGNPPTKPVVSEKDESKFKSSEFEIVEREDRDVPPPKPKAEFEIAEKGIAVKPVLPPPPPPSSTSTTIKSDPATVPDPVKDNTSRPEVKVDSDDKKALKPAVPENKVAAHVKFQEDDVKENSGKGHVPAVDFATLEKGETVVKPPGVTTGNAIAGDAVEDFLSAEQAHGGQLLHRHHESIQDQQL